MPGPVSSDRHVEIKGPALPPRGLTDQWAEPRGVTPLGPGVGWSWCMPAWLPRANCGHFFPTRLSQVGSWEHLHPRNQQTPQVRAPPTLCPRSAVCRHAAGYGAGVWGAVAEAWAVCCGEWGGAGHPEVPMSDPPARGQGERAEGTQAEGPVRVQPGHPGNCKQMRGGRWGWRSIQGGCLRLGRFQDTGLAV